MACDLPPLQIAAGVFTDGTTTFFFVPLSGGFPVAKAAMVGISLEVVSMTSALTMQLAIQYSDDGVTWDASGTTVGASFASLGWQYRGLTSTDGSRRWVRVGLLCKNTTSSGPVQKGHVALSLTFRG